MLRHIKETFSVKDGMMSREDIHQMMIDNTRIRGSNMCILMLAIVIACVGLNTNSTAVIIGAMLISPLMSGIITMGYSIASKDMELFGHALIRFGIQVAISLATSALYFLISPLSAPTEELLARTSPNAFDVLIAICGGLAGMIGCTRKERSNVIPGVAIATALMPPLCTAGYGISNAKWDVFLGAFYLFFINTVFIAVTSGLIAKALGMPERQQIPPDRLRKINIKIALLVAVTVVPSIVTAAFAVSDSVTRTRINEFVEENFSRDGLMIVSQRSDLHKKTVTLAVIGEEITAKEIAEKNEKLPEYKLEDFTLKIIQN